MATEEKRGEDKPTQCDTAFEVITLTSDEEDESGSSDEHKYSFDRFILACRQHIEKEALTGVRDLFKAAPVDLVSSREITEMLKRSTKLVNKDNASMLLDEFCEILKSGKVVANGPTASTTSKINSLGVESCSDVTKARDFKEARGEALVNSATDVAEASDDEVDFVREVHIAGRSADMPSTSAAHRHHRDDELKIPKTGKMATKDLTSQQKKRLGRKLKLRLKEISQQIKILNKSELTLEEMDMPDSSYIKENQLKNKFDKTWNKLCKILGRPPNTGRVVEKSIKPSTTGYRIIDQAVEKFMRHKHGKFPDYFDIRDVVMKANEEHDLRMSPQVLKGIIADVFTDIGNKLQRLREKDLMFNFGSHLLDDFKIESDPALANEELLQKLEKNRRVSRKNLKNVYAKYTHLERYGKTGKKGETSTDTIVKQDDDSDIDSTTTEDEKEINKALTDVTPMSDDDDFVNATSTSPSWSHDNQTVNTEDILDNGSQSTGNHVSIVIDCDSVDEPSLDESSTLLNLSIPTKPNLETDCIESESVDDSSALNDDCCIIDNPAKSDNPSDQQTQTTSLLSTEEKPYSSKFIAQTTSKYVKIGDSRSEKRKLHVEELVSVLKRRKLKAPANQNDKISEHESKKNGVVPLCDRTYLNGGSPHTSNTEALHTSTSQHSNSAVGGSISTSNEQKTANDSDIQTDKVLSSAASTSTIGKNGLVGHANNEHKKEFHNIGPLPTRNSNGEKNGVIHVIVIDD